MTRPMQRTIKAKKKSNCSSPGKRERQRQEALYRATSKRLTDEITGFTGLEREPGESWENFDSRQFERSCEILNTEIDILKNQQATFLRGERRPIILVDRDCTLVMVIRAFADYLRFKPIE